MGKEKILAELEPLEATIEAQQAVINHLAHDENFEEWAEVDLSLALAAGTIVRTKSGHRGVRNWAIWA